MGGKQKKVIGNIVENGEGARTNKYLTTTLDGEEKRKARSSTIRAFFIQRWIDGLAASKQGMMMMATQFIRHINDHPFTDGDGDDADMCSFESRGQARS